MIINLDMSIRAMKANVKTAIDGTLQGLLIVKADLDREASRFPVVSVMLGAGKTICKYCPSARD